MGLGDTEQLTLYERGCNQHVTLQHRNTFEKPARHPNIDILFFVRNETDVQLDLPCDLENNWLSIVNLQLNTSP